MAEGLRSAAFAKAKCHLEQEKGIPAGGSKLNTCAVAFMTQNKRSRCQSVRRHSRDAHMFCIGWMHIVRCSCSGELGLLVILIRKSNYCTIVAVNCLFLLLWLLSASVIYFTTSVEIKIIVELMQPQESNYIAIIPFGCRLIEVVILSGNVSCCVLKGFDQCCVLRDK